MFRNNERAVSVGFGDGEADVRQVWNVAPVVLAIAARSLRATFDDVSGDCSGGKSVPIRFAPTELVDDGSERQARVNRATCDDDLCALIESFDHRPRAEINIRALDRSAHAF